MMRVTKTRLAKLEARAPNADDIGVIRRIVVDPGGDIAGLISEEVLRLETERGRPFPPGRRPVIPVRVVVGPPAKVAG